jgi:hypothetical protein
MIRAVRCLALAAALAFSATDAAAQPSGGAYEVPMGSWEYRWLTRVDAQGNVTREPARGYLRMQASGRHSHQRDAAGTRMTTVGPYGVEGHLLYLPHTDMDSGRMVRDTFAVRRIGDRVLLWQQVDGETWEYTLAAPDAPVEPAVVPGVVTSVQGWVQSLLFFESDGGAVPRAERRYATEFRADSTRYLNVQLDLAHALSLRDQPVSVACTFTNTDLGAGATMEWTTTVRRGNASSGISTGWGDIVPGSWRPGTYQVLCTVDGVPAPEAGFVLR